MKKICVYQAMKFDDIVVSTFPNNPLGYSYKKDDGRYYFFDMSAGLIRHGFADKDFEYIKIYNSDSIETVRERMFLPELQRNGTAKRSVALKDLTEKQINRLLNFKDHKELKMFLFAELAYRNS